MHAEPQNPLDALGLPASWAPVPIAWRFASMNALTDAGTETIRVVLIDTPTGRVGFAFPGDTLRAFAQQCLGQVTGITIASELADYPTNGHARP